MMPCATLGADPGLAGFCHNRVLIFGQSFHERDFRKELHSSMIFLHRRSATLPLLKSATEEGQGSLFSSCAACH